MLYYKFAVLTKNVENKMHGLNKKKYKKKQKKKLKKTPPAGFFRNKEEKLLFKTEYKMITYKSICIHFNLEHE
jgi:hypothetical protein